MFFSSEVTFSLPHVTNKATQLLGYDIPEGAIIIANLYSAHIDEKYWKDPHEFIPERFLDENGKLRRRDAFVPFSAGNVYESHCLMNYIWFKNNPTRINVSSFNFCLFSINLLERPKKLALSTSDVTIQYSRQKRSTEGCSKFIRSVDMTSS